MQRSWNAGRYTFTQRRHGAGSGPELQVIVSGAARVRVEERRYELVTASVLFVPAGVAYETSGDAVVLSIHVPDSACRVVGERTSRAWSLNLLRECATREPGWELLAEGWTTIGLGHLARLYQLAKTRPAWLDDVVELARTHRPLTEIARIIGRHPSHIAREFRRHEGVTVGEYSRRCRLELAARELSTGAASLSSVALGAGFCDQSHFTNAFHRVFGVTPAEYRRKAVDGKRLGLSS